MHTDREVTSIVRSWMEEGATALPDRVLDAVLDQVPTTSQRRSWWPSWRFTDMNNVLKLATGAAAVLALTVVGYSFLPIAGGVGAPTATPTPSPSSAMSPDVGALQPGTYSVSDPTVTAVPFSFTVPSGWAWRSDGYVYKNGETAEELGLATFNVTHVYTDACKSEGALTEIGPTVDDLVRALEDQVGSDASTPIDLTLGGYPSKLIDMSVPTDLDASTCSNPNLLIQIWADAAETSWFAIAVDYVGTSPVHIVDVDGARAVFLAGQPGAASASDLDELQAILDSITFQP